MLTTTSVTLSWCSCCMSINRRVMLSAAPPCIRRCQRFGNPVIGEHGKPIAGQQDSIAWLQANGVKHIDGTSMRIPDIEPQGMDDGFAFYWGRKRLLTLPLRKFSINQVEEFGAAARLALSDSENPLAKPFLRAVASKITLKPESFKVSANRFKVAASVSRWDGKYPSRSVPDIVSKWRARQESNL